MFILKNISKEFNGQYALKNINLKIKGGLNYIVGPSGSGKTTLLKILTSMDQSFSGEAIYNGVNVKELKGREKTNYYGNTVGVVWQNYNLLENLTVLDNLKIPLYLEEELNIKLIYKVLRDLKIYHLKDTKVKKLSGGQKQRVAFAREILKNAEIIIADEPTAALDPKTAQIINKILRDLSKTKTVIIVTHNREHIEKNAKVFELKKGILVNESGTSTGEVFKKKNKKIKETLSLSNSLGLGLVQIKCNLSRTSIFVFGLVIALCFMLLGGGGNIDAKSNRIFDELIKTYGNNILDISIVSSFMSADGNSDNKVSQSINGIYDRYKEDPRIETILFFQSVKDINIDVEGVEYDLDFSGSSPVFNTLVQGEFVEHGKQEVIVPESFVKQTGFTNEEIIGKTIQFKGTLSKFEGEKVVYEEVSVELVVVGVADTSYVIDINGEKKRFEVGDAFFFSKSIIEELREQAGITKEDISFFLRAKDPESMIKVKDELNKEGVVPLGRFELIEDIVKLNEQSDEQSGMARSSMSILAIILVLAVTLITGLLRKREYAVYRINGFAHKHIFKTAFLEHFVYFILELGLVVVLSPLINYVVRGIFGVELISLSTLEMVFGYAVLLIGLSLVVTGVMIGTTQEYHQLKKGN